MKPLLALSSVAWTGLLAAGEAVPPWLDQASRVGVVGILLLALFGLHRRWWVPGWAYRDLEERHQRLRSRYDTAIDLALQSSRGVERTATVLEQALARGERERR